MPEFLTQRTFWAGLALIGFGAFSISQGQVDVGATKIAQGFGLIFLRQSIAKLAQK